MPRELGKPPYNILDTVADGFACTSGVPLRAAPPLTAVDASGNPCALSRIKFCGGIFTVAIGCTAHTAHSTGGPLLTPRSRETGTQPENIVSFTKETGSLPRDIDVECLCRLQKLHLVRLRSACCVLLLPSVCAGGSTSAPAVRS